jgi:hypothetical protein
METQLGLFAIPGSCAQTPAIGRGHVLPSAAFTQGR